MSDKPNWLKNSESPIASIAEQIEKAKQKANESLNKQRASKNTPKTTNDIIGAQQKKIIDTQIYTEKATAETIQTNESTTNNNYPIPGTLLLLFFDNTNYGLQEPGDIYDENGFILFSNFHIVDAIDYSTENELKESLITFIEIIESYKRVGKNVRGEHFIFSGKMLSQDISIKKTIEI